MMAGAGHLLRPKIGAKRGLPGSCDLQELLNTEQSMINYSIVMRSVKANLLEINQAKKDGKEPEKKDTDLVKTEKQNAFAISQYTDVMTSAPSSTSP